jgi:tetratricopeptide (TPR) repeat protein
VYVQGADGSHAIVNDPFAPASAPVPAVMRAWPRPENTTSVSGTVWNVTCQFHSSVPQASAMQPAKISLPLVVVAPDSALNVPRTFALGSTSRPLGILASLVGRFDDAARHFDDALRMNERMEARPWVAHTQEAYARMLLRRNARGDREHADELLSRARAAYQELGMQDAAENAAALARTGTHA